MLEICFHSLSLAFFFISLEFFQNDFLGIENISWGVCCMPAALLLDIVNVKMSTVLRLFIWDYTVYNFTYTIL